MRDIDDVFSAVDAAKGWMHKANCKTWTQNCFSPKTGTTLTRLSWRYAILVP
jgi:hypothetical protein